MSSKSVRRRRKRAKRQKAAKEAEEILNALAGKQQRYSYTFTYDKNGYRKVIERHYWE